MSDPTPPADPRPDQTFVEVVFQTLRDAAEALIANVPEVRSAALLIDWAVPMSGELPPGVAYARGPDGLPGEVRHPLPLFGLLQQNARMGLVLATRFQQLLVAADETARDLARLINERHAYLDGLNARVNDARAAARAAGLDPDGAGTGPAAG